MENKVLVVRVPDRAEIDQRTLRDFIVESLRMGVLVIGQGVNYKVEDMSDLGGVALFGGHNTARRPESEQKSIIFQLPSAQEEAPEGQDTDVPESGTQAEEPVLREKNAGSYATEVAEKRRIRERMELFRKVNGLGCWKSLEKAIKSKRITEAVIRQIYLGEITVRIEDWRMIDKGLTKLGCPIPDEKGAADG